MQDVVSNLIQEGYSIKTIPKSQEGITGLELSTDFLAIPLGKTDTIQAIYKGNSENFYYYVLIDNQYYEMNFTTSHIHITTTPTDIQTDVNIAPITATISTGNNLTVTQIEETTITLQANNIPGDSIVTVSCGNVSTQCPIKVMIVPTNNLEEPSTEINTDYGLVDVIWLNEDTNMYSSTPNVPYLYEDLPKEKQLTPVTWSYHVNGVTVNNKIVNWTQDATPTSTWYNYSANSGKDGKLDNTTSMWANAINNDGSYFVWIPRFAYRVTYYSDPSYSDLTGYYDGYGMWKADNGQKKYNLDAGIETVTHNGYTYIVHPAFMNDTSKTDSLGNPIADFDRGGWDKNLTGFWIAKYEMSTKNSKYFSEPGVKCANTIKVGNMYQAGISYDTEKESHMLKNSEWGAVAFLAYSQYGRNAHEISLNNTTITGNGEGETLEDETTINHEYNTILGARASTTGNIYGVYDMAGGGWEHVAGYDKLGQPARLTNSNGINMTKHAKDPVTGAYISTKYLTAYSNGQMDNVSVDILYNMGKVGDASKEVRCSSGDTYWNGDFSRFIAYTVPYYGRGGSAGYESAGGIFYTDSTSGGAYGSVTFRVSLAK